MTLEHVALAILVILAALLVYGIVAVYGLPYQIARSRNHPHQDAIGAATWVSLFTLGVLWPFLWIWAMAYRPDRGFGLNAEARTQLDEIEQRLRRLEQSRQP